MLFTCYNLCSYWPDPAIPSLGVFEEFGKKTSAIFVNPCPVPVGTYGTRYKKMLLILYLICQLCRTQTVLTVTHDGVVNYTERTNLTAAARDSLTDPVEWNTVSHSFQIAKS